MKQNKIPRNEYIRKPVGKTNPYKEDTLYTDMGQWKYPGQVTKIPSGDITMQGVPYPVYGEDNLGYSQMMYPGMDYQFPGQYVTEYPQIAKYGGGLLNKTLTCPKCGWSWKAVDGGKDIATCHKCGGTAKLAYGGDPSLPNIEGHYPFGGQNSKTGTHFEEGGWLDKYQKAGQLRAATTYQGAIQNPVEKEKKEATRLKQIDDKLKTSDKAFVIYDGALYNNPYADPERNEFMMMDKTGSYVPSGVTPFDIMLPVQAASAFKAGKASKALIDLNKRKTLPAKAAANAPKGNMYGQNQVLTQQSRLLDPEIKAKFFKHQAPEIEAKIHSNILGQKMWKQPKDYGNRITPENYEDFVKNIHGSTEYGIAAPTGFKPGNLGVGDYGKPGMVFSDAPLNNLGKDIVNAHEKNHGMFVGTLSKEMSKDLLKPFGTNKPIPFYGSKVQPDEVLARMAQFKNAVGMSDNQPFTLDHLNLIRKNYAKSFLDNGITEMLNKIKPGSSGEKHFLNNMNKYAFGVGAPAAIGASALQEEKDGGWLDAYDDEYRRGGQRRRGTSKNIQSSINDVFERNYDVFGPAGKLRFNPRARYKEGGWLDQYQEAGQLRTASTTAAVPVSTKAPINPVNPESTMGIADFVKHRWNTRDQRASDWNMMMMDKTGSYVDSGVDPFTLMLSAPQQVIKTATALKTIKSGTPKSLKVSQAPRKSYQDLTIRDKVINPSKPITSIPEELQPYISRTNPDFFKLYDKNLSKTEMEKKLLENTTFFDRKGNVIPAPENLKKTGGQSGWLDKYNNF